MKVPDGEGVANRTGPESCVYIRKDMGEALTGDLRAGLLSRERYSKLRGADVYGISHPWYFDTSSVVRYRSSPRNPSAMILCHDVSLTLTTRALHPCSLR